MPTIKDMTAQQFGRNRNRWIARIRKRYLGSFDSAVTAAYAYDAAARATYGQTYHGVNFSLQQ